MIDVEIVLANPELVTYPRLLRNILEQVVVGRTELFTVGQLVFPSARKCENHEAALTERFVATLLKDAHQQPVQ